MPRQPNSSPQTRAVMAALSEAPGTWRHGYDLSKATGIKSGTLYPLLIRLHKQGCLEAQWLTDEGGRPRHSYRLTGEGRALAASLAAGQPAPAPRGPRAAESL